VLGASHRHSGRIDGEVKSLELEWIKISEEAGARLQTAFIARQAADYLTWWGDNAALARLCENGRPGKFRVARSIFTFSNRQN
jgi:hypothetical protein